MSDRLLKESDVLREVESLLISDETRHLNDLEYGNNQALYHVIDRIEDLPSADRPQWIPCSERLPETKSVDDWTKALVCSADGGRAVGSFNSEYGWTFSHYFDAVVAWMPLPEPWKGADDD